MTNRTTGTDDLVPHRRLSRNAPGTRGAMKSEANSLCQLYTATKSKNSRGRNTERVPSLVWRMRSTQEWDCHSSNRFLGLGNGRTRATPRDVIPRCTRQMILRRVARTAPSGILAIEYLFETFRSGDGTSKAALSLALSHSGSRVLLKSVCLPLLRDVRAPEYSYKYLRHGWGPPKI